MSVPGITFGGTGPMLSDCAFVCRLWQLAESACCQLLLYRPVLANLQLRQASSPARHAGDGRTAFVGVGMYKAPARALVTLLLLLLGTATTCGRVAGRQGDSLDAPQLRKLLQSKPTAPPILDCLHPDMCCNSMPGATLLSRAKVRAMQSSGLGTENFGPLPPFQQNHAKQY